MTDPDAEQPFQLDSISTSPLGTDRLVVRIDGRWEGRKRPHADEAELVVENEGRRHRFPVIPQEGKPKRVKRHELWSGSFDLPLWLGSRLEGQTSLKLGEATITLPADSFAAAGRADETSELRAEVARLRTELAAREAAQETAQGEAAALRAELERVADELATVRANALAQGGLEQAEELLAQARELRSMLAAPEASSHEPVSESGQTGS